MIKARDRLLPLCLLAPMILGSCGPWIDGVRFPGIVRKRLAQRVARVDDGGGRELSARDAAAPPNRPGEPGKRAYSAPVTLRALSLTAHGIGPRAVPAAAAGVPMAYLLGAAIYGLVA